MDHRTYTFSSLDHALAEIDRLRARVRVLERQLETAAHQAGAAETSVDDVLSSFPSERPSPVVNDWTGQTDWTLPRTDPAPIKAVRETATPFMEVLTGNDDVANRHLAELRAAIDRLREERAQASAELLHLTRLNPQRLSALEAQIAAVTSAEPPTHAEPPPRPEPPRTEAPRAAEPAPPTAIEPSAVFAEPVRSAEVVPHPLSAFPEARASDVDSVASAPVAGTAETEPEATPEIGPGRRDEPPSVADAAQVAVGDAESRGAASALTAQDPGPAAPVQQPETMTPGDVADAVLAKPSAVDFPSSDESTPRSRAWRGPLVAAVVLVVAVAAVWWFSRPSAPASVPDSQPGGERSTSRSPSESEPAQSSPPNAAGTPGTMPDGGAGTPAVAGTPAAGVDAVTPPAATTSAPSSTPASQTTPVQFTTSREVWLRVVVDGHPALEALLGPNRTVTYDAAKSVAVRAGDAGAVSVTVGGKPRGTLGGDGAVVSTTIDVTTAAAAR